MKYPTCPDCRENHPSMWNGIICRTCGHDASEYDKTILPGHPEYVKK